jgi:hypothetical protein
MARIKGKDIYLKHDDQVYFGDNQEAALWFDDNELRLDHTISGTAATQGYHLVRLDQVPDEFLDLVDTPADYTGYGSYYVSVKPGENGLEFTTVSGGEKGETGHGLWASARVDGNGTVRDSFNMNVSRTAAGTYSCTFIVSPSNAYYGVSAQPYQTVTDTNAMVSSVSTAGFTLTIGQGDNGGTPDTLLDTDFSVLVFHSEGFPETTISGMLFTQLLDTPGTYSGSQGKVVTVNSTEDGLEFTDIITTVSGITYKDFAPDALLRAPAGQRPGFLYAGPVAGLAFDDTSDEYVFGSFRVPENAKSGEDCILRLYALNDTAQTAIRTCKWCLDYHTYDNGENYTSKTTTTVCNSTTLQNNAPAGDNFNTNITIDFNDANNPLTNEVKSSGIGLNKPILSLR